MKISAITLRYAFILGLVALCCTTLSSVVYLLTKNQIEQAAAVQQRQLLLEVIPQDQFDNDILATCKQLELPQAKFLNKIYLAKKSEKLTAYAIQATAPDGYSGNIVLLIGIQPDGTILGVRTLAHKETPGLGDKIETRLSNWIYHFTGLKFRLEEETLWAVKKDGGQFDQFTGATITPRAVVNNVRQTAKWVLTMLNHHPEMLNQLINCNQ